MWYFNGEIIKTPKTMVISDITHPKGIFRDSAMLTSLGIKPYRSVTPDDRYYDLGSYTVDTSGDEVVGTYAGTAKTVATLTASMLDTTKSIVSSKHAIIDWYWVRASKSGGTAVPSAIATYSAALYTEYAAKKTEIAALDTLAKVIEYENRAYTEVRKDVKDDGTYHASDTTSTAKEINMVTHYTVHPDDVDAGQVSLTAD